MKKELKLKENKGIYLVINPKMEETKLLERLQFLMDKGIVAVQIWDNFDKIQDKIALIEKILKICRKAEVPLLINNRWELLTKLDLDGVHFDEIPENGLEIKNEIGRDFLLGITCENDLKDVEWAAKNRADYISFCSMFPSVSAGACEIVSHETVQKAREIFPNRIFLAGGISPENLEELSDLDFDGIAVISGLMNTEEPEKELEKYKNNLIKK
ncbi:MAG: thiamine phosphate synthase [Flavobacteriaceae bacterium]|nr:thiamine phosphate synthase [Flavobacteriaceae bacterium]